MLSASPSETSVRLNLGAGRSYIPGMVNIDIAARAEVTLNLSIDKLPYRDDSVDLVFSYHTLEHVPNYLFALGEIHRVLKHGAPFLMGVPYVTNAHLHQVNPYHLHDFSEMSFDYFDPDKLLGSAAEEHPIMFRKAFHRYQYMGRYARLPARLQDWARRHLWNTVDRINFGVVALKTLEHPVQFDSLAMQAEFDRLLASRQLYPD